MGAKNSPGMVLTSKSIGDNEMKKIIFVSALFSLSFSSSVIAQHLWPLEPADTDYGAVDNDTSVAHLEALIQSRNSWGYLPAARLLAYNHGDTEKNFLLSNLRVYANLSASWMDWEKYFQSCLIRGYLDDQVAILCMDTVARFSTGGQNSEAGDNDLHESVCVGSKCCDPKSSNCGC